MAIDFVPSPLTVMLPQAMRETGRLQVTVTVQFGGRDVRFGSIPAVEVCWTA